MVYRALKFRSTLNNATGGAANYLFLGDLNSMGLEYPYSHDIGASNELKRWDRRSGYYDMKRLSNTYDVSWFNGSGFSIPDCNLDHVYAAKHLTFKNLRGPARIITAVDVRGRVDKTTSASKDQWISKYSDLSLLYLEVQRV